MQLKEQKREHDVIVAILLSLLSCTMQNAAFAHNVIKHIFVIGISVSRDEENEQRNASAVLRIRFHCVLVLIRRFSYFRLNMKMPAE